MINVHNRAHSNMYTHTHTPVPLYSFYPSFILSSPPLLSSLCSLTFLHLTMQLKCPSHLKHQDTFQL